MSSAARADEDYGDEKDDEEEVPLQFKIVILGDGAVGKTSLVARFIEDTFSQSYKQTLGVDFHSNKVILPDGQDVTLQLWDIGGQSIGSKMLPHYISGSHAVLLAYDITNKESFANLEEWDRVVAKTFKGQNPVVTGLVANKSDMMHSCEVSTVEHNRFADENRMHSYRLSAKSGDQVHACFTRVAALLAGVKMSGTDIARKSRAVPATVLTHQQHDPQVLGGEMPEHKRGKKSSCLVS